MDAILRQVLLSGSRLPLAYVATGAVGYMSTAVGMPAGVVAGQFLLMPVISFGSAVTTPGSAASSTLALNPSWSHGTTFGRKSASGGPSVIIELFYKFASGGDAAPTLDNQTGGIDGMIGQIMSFNGVNTTSPFEAVTGSTNVSYSSGVAYDNITTLGGGRLVYQLFGANPSPTGTPGAPNAGWAMRIDQDQNVIGGHFCMQMDEKFFAESGAIGTGTHTISNSSSFSDIGRLAFALVPA